MIIDTVIITCREGVIDVADGKIVNVLGLTDDNEYLITFEKKKP